MHDVASEARRLDAKIGVVRPLHEFTKHFFVPGRIRSQSLPPPDLTPEFQRFEVPFYGGPGSTLPIVYLRSGYVRFGTAQWGMSDSNLRVDKDAPGYPCLIFADLIDLRTVGENEPPARVYATSDTGLFIASAFTLGEFGCPRTVLPLLQNADFKLRKIVDWAPAFESMDGEPSTENFAFLRRERGPKLTTRSLRIDRADQ